MDIQVASNFERALFEASGRDSGWTGAAMADFARAREIALPPSVLANLRARYSAFACDDDETRAAIARVHAATGRIIDPHTAVAVAAAEKWGAAAASPLVILSTAHPAKFPAAVEAALGSVPPVPSRLAGLSALPEKAESLRSDTALIRGFISSRLGA
jgi:threonine synthase